MRHNLAALLRFLLRSYGDEYAAFVLARALGVTIAGPVVDPEEHPYDVDAYRHEVCEALGEMASSLLRPG